MNKKLEPFPQESFSALYEIEDKHWWFRARKNLLMWVLKNKVSFFKDFLEVGCGTGFILEGVQNSFPKVRLFGSDYFEEGLVYAKKRVASAKFKKVDLRLLDDLKLYDVIGAFDVIEHIQEDELVLNNLTNALRSGGYLVLTVPQHSWLWSEVDEKAHHVRRYSRKELTEKIIKAGLEVEYQTSFVMFLTPFMWFARLPSQSKDYDPMKEFNIPLWLNNILGIIMFFESILLKAGLSLPFGGSLLLVTKKI